MWESNNNYIFPPKVGGEPITVTIVDLKRNYDVEPDKCYKSPKKTFDYWDEFILKNGKVMPCNTWKLYFALREANVQPGDTVTITHPSSGVYNVKIKKNENQNNPPEYDKAMEELSKSFNAQEVKYDT